MCTFGIVTFFARSPEVIKGPIFRNTHFTTDGKICEYLCNVKIQVYREQKYAQ